MSNRLKKCFACGIVKNTNDFHIVTKRSDGCAVYCKKCTSKKSAEKYKTELATRICKECKKSFIATRNMTHCSRLCSAKKRIKGITGYKKCLICSNQFPYRDTLLKRGDSKRGIKCATSIYCSKKCSNLALVERNKTYIMPHEIKKRIIENLVKINKGRKATIAQRIASSKAHKGEKSYFWLGGIAPENKIIRRSIEYRLWRESVFARDNFTCQECKVRGNKLHADHIKPFALFPELRFAIDNGRTLCVGCHRKTDTYGWGTLKQKLGLKTQISIINKLQ
ncbi:MAG: HNH endonuclease [Candidatus Levybacteria bacterium]|nr:HNH endonuclease [Candidatus Levybacteria bacterium]